MLKKKKRNQKNSASESLKWMVTTEYTDRVTVVFKE